MALNGPHPAGDERLGNLHATGTAGHPAGDTEVLEGAELLPCGHPLALAWEQARTRAGRPDTHHSHCRWCREAIEGFTALDRATRALRAEAPPDSRRLANRVIAAVRAEVRPRAPLVLNDPGHGLRIAESAAANLLRRAADTVPGARAASCQITPSKNGSLAPTIAITVAASLDKPLRERAEAVRQAVLHAAEHVLGLAVTTVDVNVGGVLEASRMPRDIPSELSDL